MKLLSWNVNGLRACGRKGFLRWLARSGADVVAVQEVRARVEDLPDDLRSPKGWHTHFVAADRAGYSGVGLYSRVAPDELTTSLGVRALDGEGRLQFARFGKLLVVNGYFPNGNGRDRDNSRIPYKLDFYRRLHEVLEERRARGEAIVVVGDFNTAHGELDLARPKQNVETSGFRPEERAELDRWLVSGWTDTFREFEKDGGHYTWWSQRVGVREKNIGWRIDLALASPGAVAHLRGATIHAKVKGSDHCPIGVELDDAVLGARPQRRTAVTVRAAKTARDEAPVRRRPSR